eukprot:SAG31_NODE_5373_length_2578_cov_2.885693_2_plen_714_part_00
MESALVNWVTTVQAASISGVRIFEPLLNQWKLDNSTADGITNATRALLDATLHVRSDALFVLRIHICPSVHHMYREGRNATADPPLDDGPHLPSPADADWVPKASAGLIALLTAIDARYPRKVIGLHLTALQSGEWSQPLPAVGNTDYSNTFRRLYCAKMNESMSCELPSTVERNVQRTGTASICATSPTTVADRAVGANMLHNDVVSVAIAGVAENVKAATENKLLILVFYGYLQAGSYEQDYAADMVSYGHLSGRRLLESPYVDGFVSPFEYVPAERAITSPLGPEKLFSSLALHGKLAMIEDDTRTNLDSGTGFKWCFTLNCTVAMMRRDMFAAGLTGRGLYHFDLQGAGWFGENRTTAQRGTTSAIWHAIGEAQDALRKVTPSAGPLGLPQTAVFVDERAPLTQPLGQGQWGLKNINQELLRMGAPYRSYYVDDLAAVDKASIRLAIFPNLLTPSKVVKAALAAWQQNASVNTTFVFFGPAGLVQSDVRDYPPRCFTDIAAVPVVTGIPELREHVSGTTSRVQLKQFFSTAEAAAFPGIATVNGTVYGSAITYASAKPGPFSPLMTVASRLPASVMVLGTYETSDGHGGDPNTVPMAALVAKARAGGGYNVYSAANAMPSTLFTAFARSSGAHIFSDNGSECGIQASGNGLAIQAIRFSNLTPRGGLCRITLPTPLMVTSGNGTKVCATACREFLTDLAVGHSELFIVE